MGKLEVDQQLIRELAALLDDTGLTEIEIRNDDQSLRIARQAAAVTVSAAPAMAPEAAGEPADAGAIDASDPRAITSPMVGTAFRSAEPSAPPYVNIGDSVTAGQTLLIIEAMKTFNEIPATRAGTVTAIMFENQTPVEFGDVLMVIE